VIFTTPERDNVIYKSESAREAVARLKSRYLVGLHHNWHDYAFRYDPLFDFSMAGDGDLIEAEGKPFPRIPIDACNFSPSAFQRPRAQAPFWDVLYVARAVAFKGIPEFLAAVRKLYDEGHRYRVLFICSMPPVLELPGIPDLRAHFEAMFTPEERQRFSLLTLDWDYPFPFDLETLSHFYANSRVFLHPAPEERRCRVAAYAWANGMPVVANSHVASILPEVFRRPPFLFEFASQDGIAEAVTRALAQPAATDASAQAVCDEFSNRPALERLDRYLLQLAQGGTSAYPVNPDGLDIRLGRHHQLAVGGNRIPYGVEDFCQYLSTISDSELEVICQGKDPEIALGHWGTAHGGALHAPTASGETAAGAGAGGGDVSTETAKPGLMRNLAAFFKSKRTA
jgi:glycosyltransferase involved in cell wall biosynthesis